MRPAATQFLQQVLRPALSAVHLGGIAAENLLLGTLAVESDFGMYTRQRGGPALGMFQMELLTHRSLWRDYLAYRPQLQQKVLQVVDNSEPKFLSEAFFTELEHALVENPAYAAIMARLKYCLTKEKLPFAYRVEELAAYWKQHYNTAKGRGRVEVFCEKFKQYVGKDGFTF